jgi:PAS domain S-box-containing protein
MADRIRAFDWSTTALGPIESWSDVFTSTVNLLLSFPFSFAIYFGEEQILLYNDVFRPFLDVKHPAALGKSGAEVWPEAWDVLGPQIAGAFHQGQSFSNKRVLVPILIGDHLEDRWWTYGFHPIYDDGKVIGVSNPGHEDTAEVLATRALKESEQKLSQVLNASTDAIVSVDTKWVMTYLNPMAVNLYSGGRDLLGMTVWDAFPTAAEEDSPVRKHYYRAMTDRVPGSFDVFYPAPLNLWIHVEVHPTPDGGIVTFSRNITAEKQAQAALLQNEKLTAVGRLASSIAHEINNPLEAVTNLIYLSRRSQNLTEVQEMLELADQELSRVSVIANQTLRFHKQSSHPREITCSELFSTVLSLYQNRLRNFNISVHARKRADKPVLVYEGDIRQVLNNLVGNAIDAMPTGGRLLIRSHVNTRCGGGGPAEAGIVLTIADTGVGIPAQQITRIFEPFFTTKGHGGTGLGLWISAEILRRHNGSIRIRSSQKRNQHGTVVRVFLPYKSRISPVPSQTAPV